MCTRSRSLVTAETPAENARSHQDKKLHSLEEQRELELGGRRCKHHVRSSEKSRIFSSPLILFFGGEGGYLVRSYFPAPQNIINRPSRSRKTNQDGELGPFLQHQNPVSHKYSTRLIFLIPLTSFKCVCLDGVDRLTHTHVCVFLRVLLGCVSIGIIIFPRVPLLAARERSSVEMLLDASSPSPPTTPRFKSLLRQSQTSRRKIVPAFAIITPKFTFHHLKTGRNIYASLHQ